MQRRHAVVFEPSAPHCRWQLKALTLFSFLGGLAVWQWLVQCRRRRDAAYQEHTRLQSLRPPDSWQRRGSVTARPKRRD